MVVQRQWPWQQLLMQQDSNSNQRATWEAGILTTIKYDNQLAVHYSAMILLHSKTASNSNIAG